MDAILNGPAMAPPPGETSNFSNPPNENPLAIGVLVTMIVISTVCVLVRLYARVYLLRKVQAEESECSPLVTVPDLDLPPTCNVGDRWVTTILQMWTVADSDL